MKYERPQAEVEIFSCVTFMTQSYHDQPLGQFTCGEYQQRNHCNNIVWGSGYACGVYSNGNCQSVYSPPGSTGDGCNAWKLTCSKF